MNIYQNFKDYFFSMKQKKIIKRFINGCLNSVTEDFGRWYSLKIT